MFMSRLVELGVLGVFISMMTQKRLMMLFCLQTTSPSVVPKTRVDNLTQSHFSLYYLPCYSSLTHLNICR